MDTGRTGAVRRPSVMIDRLERHRIVKDDDSDAAETALCRRNTSMKTASWGLTTLYRLNSKDITWPSEEAINLDNNRVYDIEPLITDWRPIGSDVRPTTSHDLLSLLTFTLKHGAGLCSVCSMGWAYSLWTPLEWWHGPGRSKFSP